MTGTDGGSNLTFPVFWLLASAIPLSDAFDVPERLSPPRPFHSASSESGAVEFASIQWNRQIKSPRQNNKTIILFQIFSPVKCHTITGTDNSKQPKMVANYMWFVSTRLEKLQPNSKWFR